MAVIINTAMERVECAACDGFWRVKYGEILPHILHVLVWKWVIWMYFVTFAVMEYRVYELVCSKVDKSFANGRHTLAAIFSTLTEYRIAHKAVAYIFVYFENKLHNDIKVNMLYGFSTAVYCYFTLRYKGYCLKPNWTLPTHKLYAP